MKAAALLPTTLLLLATTGCKEDAPPVALEGAPPGLASAATEAPAPSVTVPSPAVGDATPFEGQVDLALNVKLPKASSQKLSMLVKGSRTRVDMLEAAPEGGVSQIVDGKTGKMISLAHGPKLAMNMNLGSLFGSLAPWMPKGTAEHPETPQVKRTERTETIAGEPCRYWDYEVRDGTRGSVCLARLGIGWMSLDGVEEARWVRSAFGDERFPLKSVGFDATGKESVSMEVTRLERKSVPDSAFDVPAGYRRMDTSNLVEGLMPAMMAGSEGAKPDPMKMPEDMQEMLEKLKKGQKP